MNAPTLPANISTAGAKLPVSYEHAKQALATCNNLDECKDWADKAAALASYAKQADDDELYNMARRIQGRAVKRVGELLQAFKNAGARTDQPRAATGPRSGREAGHSVGMSDRQIKTAANVARVNDETFENWVESDAPPSVTKLAEAGKQSRPVSTEHLQGRDPDQFYAATHTMGAIRRLAERCEAHPAAFVAGGVTNETAEMRVVVPLVIQWLSDFLAGLRGAQ